MPATRTLSLGVIAVTLALAYGIWYAYSVIPVALLNEYGWSRGLARAGAAGATLKHAGIRAGSCRMLL